MEARATYEAQRVRLREAAAALAEALAGLGEAAWDRDAVLVMREENKRLREELRETKEKLDEQSTENNRLREKLRETQQKLVKQTTDNDYWWNEAERLRALIDDKRQHDYLRGHDLCLSTPLCKNATRSVSLDTDGRDFLDCGYNWRQYAASCPMCKRPLRIRFFRRNDGDGHGAAGAAGGLIPAGPRRAEERWAYAAAVWGSCGGYTLGALVLGARLRELAHAPGAGGRSSPALVLLHTDDVPQNYLAALGKVWTLRPVDYVGGSKAMYTWKGGTFDGVFTKLHAWGLLEYDKVLLLDLDTFPIKSIEELFALTPPAAMVRGNNSWGHGKTVRGEFMFRDELDSMWPWCQAGGINAGVILLRPSDVLLDQMLKEVTSEVHPSHIPGNGPEQDYLSRCFAVSDTPWQHLDPIFNFQPHHVAYALEAVLHWKWTNTKGPQRDWLPRRLEVSLDDVRNIHFSGQRKFWHQFLDATIAEQEARTGQADRVLHTSQATFDEFVEGFLRSTVARYDEWSRTDARSSERYEAFGVKLTEEDRFVCLANEEDLTELIDHTMEKLEVLIRRSALAWRICAEKLFKDMPDLLTVLNNPTVPKKAPAIGSPVEVLWARHAQCDEEHAQYGVWLEAKVASVHADGYCVVRFARAGDWGDCERRVPPARIRVAAHRCVRAKIQAKDKSPRRGSTQIRAKSLGAARNVRVVAH